MNILELKNVSKKFGSKSVLKNLNLSVPTGSIYGFVGENGAGKTTTMKMILGLEEKNSGEIFIKGQPVHFGDNQTNHLTGYLPDVPEFYNYMSGREYLKFCGEITGLTKKQSQQKIPEILALVGLENNKKKIKGYSRGMKQRLGIAQALLNDPELLICDEPTSALDPSGRNEFLEMLSKLRRKTTILFSTHILSDVERICDYVGILDQGELVVNGPLNTLKERYARNQMEIEFSNEEDVEIFTRVLEKLEQQEVIKDYSVDSSKQRFVLTYSCDYKAVAAAIFQLFEDSRIYPKSIQKIDPSLESIFLEVIQ
ncbi:ATP-binding cassette domain-containing protein [Enterococcus sp. DIV0170]|uniref:ABC transporter ATP-binding protein n=1 Tax=Enterococcus sp. DIV0170 TaxID=2774642 RepID=UPI003F20922F